MRKFKKELELDMQLQRKLLAEHEKELADLPPGSLTLYRSGGRTYYKHTVKKGGQRKQKNVKSAEKELVEALCKKAFLKKQCRVMQTNLNAQEQLMNIYKSYSTKEILTQLKPIYAEGFNLSAAEEEIRRKQSEAISQAVHSERLTQPTLAGFYVRSKSETIIVNMMTDRRIRFVYEEAIVLEIPGRGQMRVHPDFVIYLDSGEIIIWEHLGMLSSDSYAEAQMKKLQAYHLAGYTLGKNLFFTADNADGTLDVTVISRIIDEICVHGGCY